MQLQYFVRYRFNKMPTGVPALASDTKTMFFVGFTLSILYARFITACAVCLPCDFSAFSYTFKYSLLGTYSIGNISE